MQPNSAVSFLRTLPTLLRRCANDETSPRAVRRRRPPLRRIVFRTTLSARFIGRLLDRLDCDRDGNSRRTGKAAWPESWPIAYEMAEHLGAEFYLVHLIACWLERRSPTTRRTYWYQAHAMLRDLRIHRVAELLKLPQEAALTWQRQHAGEVMNSGRQRRPRTINLATAVLNSLMTFLVSLDLVERRWVAVPPVPVNRGRHEDEDPLVLEPEQLTQYWQLASRLPKRRFLALMLKSLHGLRAAETAGIRWRDLRQRRRGMRPAPAVMHVIGKGSKHRAVQIHPSIRGYLERERVGKDPDAYVLADEKGQAPSAQQVSYWAKAVFRWMDLPDGYAHALRATWATLALENKRNTSLQVQMSGGWANSKTMRDRYFKRRQVPLVRLFDERG